MKNKLQVLDLFSGIGGFSLGLENTGGFETSAFCEIEKFPQRVLNKHWPEVPIYNDVRELTKDILDRDGITIDVITGGFPCQDISIAGRKAGINAETRSGLWSEVFRLTSELRPQFLIVENVANLLSGPTERRGGWFSRVLGDLASIGYNAEWENIPASAMGAPHRRERVWVIAYPNKNTGEQRKTLAINNEAKRQPNKDLSVKCKDRNRTSDVGWNLSEPPFLFASDGIPKGLGNAVAACGNAVIPQIPELIGNAILQELEIE